MRWILTWATRSTLLKATTRATLVTGRFPKKIQTEHGESVIQIPRDRRSEFEPVAVPKHKSRGLSIEKLVISLYAKGMSVSDIEDELREIYQINLSSSAISIITNKVTQAAADWKPTLATGAKAAC